MKTYLLHIWDSLKSSYWFVPGLMSIFAFVLGLVLVQVDRGIKTKHFVGDEIFFIGGPEGARSLLSTVASSVVTVAGVVFSITIATLTQASSQFGPRLLRNFMRDTGNQIVLGTFVSTFLYCLVVLRTVHGSNEDLWDEFVPNLSVTVAVLLAICSIAVLIYFIHHVSLSLQAPILVANVAKDLDSGIDRMFPERLGESGPAPSEPELPENFETTCQRVISKESGYVQAIDAEGIMACANGEPHRVIRLARRPGDFVAAGHALADVWPAESCDDAVTSRIRAAIFVGSERTSEQDIEYAIDQLVEIAVRALSPGINDPFTAIHCIDWLSASLTKLSEREFPSPYRLDEKGERLCVLTRVSDIDGLVDAAFNQIRQYGRDSVAVTLRLLEAIRVISQSARSQVWRQVLRQHAEMIYSQAKTVFRGTSDLQNVQDRYDQVVAALEAPASPVSPV